MQVLLNGIGHLLLRVGAQNTLHPAQKRCATVVVVGCWLILASQFVEREPEERQQSAGELLHKVLYRWGNYVRNNDAPSVLKFINVECLAFALGIGLDSWVAAMLHMASSEAHVDFLDEVMERVVLPAFPEADRARHLPLCNLQLD